MRRLLGMAATVLCVGCVGLPSKPHPVQLPTAAPLEGLGPEARGEWPAEQWWKRYHDPTLDQLIELAVGTAPTLATAHARYDAARQSVLVAGAAAGARVDANAGIERQRLSDNGLFPPRLLGFHWYNQSDLGLRASYTFDWWGKQRSAVEAAIDQAHAAEADRSAAALVLESSVADAYFGWQADQARLELARDKAGTLERERQIAASRVKAELESADSVDQWDLALALAREHIAGLNGSARLRVIELAALIGRSQSELPNLQPRPLPHVVAALPDNLKIDLIARRADITASRWRIEAAERNLDSARAEFYPDVTLNALLGFSSIDVGKLLEYGSRVPQATAAIHLPIFDAGRIKARYGVTQSSIDAAVASYQDTLVTAARDVASQASARAQALSQQAERSLQLESASRLQSSAAARVRQGISDARSELPAAESVIEQRDALLQLELEALSADIGLQRALGGGYESPQKLANSHPTSTTTAP